MLDLRRKLHLTIRCAFIPVFMIRVEEEFSEYPEFSDQSLNGADGENDKMTKRNSKILQGQPPWCHPFLLATEQAKRVET